MMPQKITIHKNTFELHPTGAIFWLEQSMLLISDVHLGKISHFRKFGAAIPRVALQKNYVLMDEVVAHFQPFRICFLGDLFHSSLNKEWELFTNWVSRTPAEIILVSGNHDIIDPELYKKLHITVLEEWIIQQFLFTHHPEEQNGYFNFCGHIHPSVKLTGDGRQTLKLPCFFKKEHQLILPAFGEFTGTHALQPNMKEEVFAIVDDEVLKI